jgi:hypothetical protein
VHSARDPTTLLIAPAPLRFVWILFDMTQHVTCPPQPGPVLVSDFGPRRSSSSGIGTDQEGAGPR